MKIYDGDVYQYYEVRAKLNVDLKLAIRNIG